MVGLISSHTMSVRLKTSFVFSEADFSTKLRCTHGSDGKAIYYYVLSKPGLRGPPPPQIGKPGDIFIGSEGAVYLHRKVLWVDTKVDDAVLYRHPDHPDLVLYIGMGSEKSNEMNLTWVLVNDLLRPSCISCLQDVCVTNSKNMASQVSSRRPPQISVDLNTTLPSPDAGRATVIDSRTPDVIERGTKRTFTESGMCTDDLFDVPLPSSRRRLTAVPADIIKHIDLTLEALQTPLAKDSRKEPELQISCPWAGCTRTLKSNFPTVFIDHALQAHIYPNNVETHALFTT